MANSLGWFITLRGKKDPLVRQIPSKDLCPQTNLSLLDCWILYIMKSFIQFHFLQKRNKKILFKYTCIHTYNNRQLKCPLDKGKNTESNVEKQTDFV